MSTRSLRALVAVSLLASLAACGSDSPTDNSGGVTTLQVTDITVGTGAAVVQGDVVTVHYIGAFLDGREFDNSYSRGIPISFRVGAGTIIPGFEQGMVGMQVGGKRKLVIPASLAYGSTGRPPTIPPNTPLQFTVELLGITK